MSPPTRNRDRRPGVAAQTCHRNTHIDDCAMTRQGKLKISAESARRAARREQAIQREVDRTEAARKARRRTHKKSKAMQAGARAYPSRRSPSSTRASPASRPSFDPAPMYDAPYYQGSDKLEDMVALITGGDSGIGRAVAVLYAREGADVAIAYLDEHDDAEETKRAVEAEGRRCIAHRGRRRRSRASARRRWRRP